MKSVSAARDSNETTGAAILWILRVGVAGCFIGHGAFGIITKAAWVPYFAAGGVNEPWAWRLMPWVGAMDIAVGCLALIWPCRALFAWALIWTVWTALLRPLAGEPFCEAVERAGNYGVPISILVIVGLTRPWFSRLRSDWSGVLAARPGLEWALRLTTFALLAGHAGLGFISHKAGLAQHYAALGVSDSAALVPLVGVLEFFLAGLSLMVSWPAFFLGVCCWKIATESLFLVAGSPVWELIERFGSYTAPFALALLLTPSRSAPATRKVLAT